MEPKRNEVATAEPTAVSEVDAFVQMVERLATMPKDQVNMDVVERIFAMQERKGAIEAERLYDEAMSNCQRDMERISQDASNPQTKSKYASYAALDRALRPIYTKYGFSVGFDTGEAVKPDDVLVLCRVKHKAGHGTTHKLPIPADGKGAKGGDVMTKTHAVMSAVSYGRRGLLKMVFNIAEGTDDDGNAASGMELITDDQVTELHQLIIDVGADLGKLLAYLKVEKLEDIYANKFETVKRLIEQKRKKKEASA